MQLMCLFIKRLSFCVNGAANSTQHEKRVCDVCEVDIFLRYAFEMPYPLALLILCLNPILCSPYGHAMLTLC